MKQLFVIMGVSGSGKSTVAQALSDMTGWPFLEGDDFHPAANVAKMAGGTPLTNQDREAWIEAMAETVRKTEPHTLLLSCSALNRFVRDGLENGCQRKVSWVYLKLSREALLNRLNNRADHFMKSDLLDSQIAAMEPPDNAIIFEADKPIDVLVTEIIKRIQSEVPKPKTR